MKSCFFRAVALAKEAALMVLGCLLATGCGSRAQTLPALASDAIAESSGANADTAGTVVDIAMKGSADANMQQFDASDSDSADGGAALACDPTAWNAEQYSTWPVPNPSAAGPAPYDADCAPVHDQACATSCDCKFAVHYTKAAGCELTAVNINVPWRQWQFLFPKNGACVAGSCALAPTVKSGDWLRCWQGKCTVQHGCVAGSCAELMP